MPAKDPIEFRQARGFSDILDATFAFIGQNFKKLGKDLLFIAGPFVLLATFLGLYLQVQTFDFDPQSFNFDTILSQVLSGSDSLSGFYSPSSYYCWSYTNIYFSI